jgi:hypothetical protein
MKRTDRTKRIEKDTDHKKRRIKKNGYSDIGTLFFSIIPTFYFKPGGFTKNDFS